jgi:hypothetical protein
VIEPLPPPTISPSSLDPKPWNTAEGSRHTQKDVRGLVEIAQKLKPKWDGDPLTWSKFLKRWNYYWNLRGPTLDPNPEMAKMVFIECLPREEAERAMQLVVNDGISLEKLIAKYNENNSSVLPRFAMEKRWRAFVPRDRKWNTIDMWYSEWISLASEAGHITQDQMKEQFDASLIRVVPKLIEKIHEEELMGTPLSLEERWNFVAQKLRLSKVLDMVRNEYEHKDTSFSQLSALNRSRGGKGKGGKGYPTPHNKSPSGRFDRKNLSSKSGSSGDERSHFDRGRPSRGSKDISRSPRERSRSPHRSGTSGDSESSHKSSRSDGSRNKRFRKTSRSSSAGSRDRWRGSRLYKRSDDKKYSRDKSPRNISRRAYSPKDKYTSGSSRSSGSDREAHNSRGDNRRTPLRRSPHPNRDIRKGGQVKFGVSSVGHTPHVSTREGDVHNVPSRDEMDAYMAVRSLRKTYPSGKKVADYGSASDHE